MDVLLLGLDSACRSILRPLFQRDTVPTIRRLVDGGASGPLESQIPPWTPSAWPSLYTGKNPGKHGAFDFLVFDGYEWDVINATHVRARPLWEIVEHRGLSSVVVNVPVTHPPTPFDGALVPGYTAPEHPDCHPPGLLEELREEIGGYRVYPRDVDDPETRYREIVRMRGEAFRYLADRVEPDFGFLEFQVTDSVFHQYPGNFRAVRAVYRMVDEQVSSILDACQPDTVFLVSDHGMGRYTDYEFRVNEFLCDRGYAVRTTGGEGQPSWTIIRERRLKAGEQDTNRSPGRAEQLMANLARLGITSRQVIGVLETLGIKEVVADVVPHASTLAFAGSEHVDFRSSTAYMRSRSELGIRINLRGREPDGVVPAEDYDEVRRELIDDLDDVETPDGDVIFQNVAPREMYFWGPEADRAVDIVTVPADFDTYLTTKLAGSEFGEPTEPWNHKRMGIVATTGEDVDTDTGLDGAHLFDIAPTVLAALGLPVDETMDGRVLPVVEPTGERAYPEYDGGDRIATSDSEVEQRLDDLGYL